MAKGVIIKSGKFYTCIKDVKVGNIIPFKKDKVYYSPCSNYLLNELGNRQLWVSLRDFNEHFKEFLMENRVNHPSHYTWLKDKCGIEVIDIVRHMNFNLGNVIKYVLRAGHKSEQGMSDKQKKIEDLEKAVFYLQDEINELKK